VGEADGEAGGEEEHHGGGEREQWARHPVLPSLSRSTPSIRLAIGRGGPNRTSGCKHPGSEHQLLFAGSPVIDRLPRPI
jgi:hypothetical protein